MNRARARATNEGPAAYVIPGDDPRPVECAEVVNLLRLMGVEVHRAPSEIKVGTNKLPAGSFIIANPHPTPRPPSLTASAGRAGWGEFVSEGVPPPSIPRVLRTRLGKGVGGLGCLLQMAWRCFLTARGC